MREKGEKKEKESRKDMGAKEGKRRRNEKNG